MTAPVLVRTPCRLHFGMFSFGRSGHAQFGGLGAMVEPPCVEVEVAPASRFGVTGVLGDRVLKIAELLVGRWGLPALPECEVNVRAPRDHTGLGVGTQLHLATAAALRRFSRLPEVTIEELARMAGRGTRSAVGTYGFQQGGLIVDGGKSPDASLGNLVKRVALPDEWRFVLFCDPNERGLAGPNEVQAFDRLPEVPESVTERLWSLTDDQILPAVEQGDCGAFGSAIYEFGRTAGECFATVQSGPFATEQTARLVALIREFGVPGAGQSSWGPTVFAVAANDEEASYLIGELQDRQADVRYEIVVARPNNCGATIEERSGSG